ncbi:MAG: VWA domain-containing protein [Blastocatellia bacterium]|nr:VWA domain-containing protein [Blastocatellia bacterium]
MKNFPVIILSVLLPALSSSAQTPVAKPTPTPNDEIVRISTNLIQLDVSVTNPKGKPITDIRRDEIEIYENGKKQDISGFRFVSSVRETVANTPVDKNAPPLPPSLTRPENVRRTIALVVDDLSLSFESAYQTRRSLKKFVDDQMQEGDLVAIVRTGAGIGALQQFTSDKRILYAAIERVKWNPLGSGGISAFAPIESTLAGQEEETPDPGGEDGPQTRDGAKVLDDFRTQGFVTGTLGALRYIVTGMAVLPGRKSVIMYSDGFSIFETNENGQQETSQVLDFLRALIDEANRASVVFYTVDARGLQTAGFTAADSISNTSPEAMNAQSSARRAQLYNTQEGLSFLADETGGFAIKNNNDLIGGVAKIFNDQSYYLIGYEPDDDTFDPAKRKFNKLEVKVSRKDAVVRYRSGFFNTANAVKTVFNTTMTPVAQLETALISPFAVNGIDLRLNALFAIDEKNSTYVRSLLHVDASDLKFEDQPDGSKTAVFDVLAMSFGDNGLPVDTLGKTYTLNAKGETLRRIQSEGFVYHFVFPVKKPGPFQFRVAIRDVKSGTLGSASQFVEVPNIKKGRLTLSSLVVDNISAQEWRDMNAPTGISVRSDAMSDTALRRVRRDSVLRYGYEIYNAKGTTAQDLKAKVRIFRDGKLFYEGTEQPVDASGQSSAKGIKAAGALAIGQKLTPGDYVLQIVVTDKLAKAKQQMAAQFVQFEVVD